MKRWSLRLVLIGSAICACAIPAEAGQGRFARKTRPARNVQREQHPPRFERISNAQTYVFRGKDGRVHTREVPSGYVEQFPTPAIFYYGYPHSGDDTGLGF